MLESIRNRSGGIIVKALLGLLILSFAMWGVADVYSPSKSKQNLAEVGNIEIKPSHVRRDYQREIERLSHTFGTRITAEQARVFGVGQNVVQSKIERTLFDLGASELGIIVSDDLVRNHITAQPSFKNSIGEFDRARFEQVLQSNRLSEDDYVKLIRGDIQRSIFLSMFDTLSLTPDILAKKLYMSRNEKRIADIVTLDSSSFTNISEPKKSDLIDFHKKNAATFTSPEFRELTFINLTVDDIAKKISVSEQAIVDSYNERFDEFLVPETRNLKQLKFQDKEMAEKAYKLLLNGREFSLVGKELSKMTDEEINLGYMKKTELLPSLSDTAFKLKKETFTKPIKSVLGWHIIRLENIIPATQKNLEEVKPELKKQIANEIALDSLYKIASQLEDSLGGGDSLEEAAQSLDLQFKSQIKIDKKGKSPDNLVVPNLPEGTFIKVAFSTNPGEESLLTEVGDDGYFILRVDKVIEPELKKFESVRNDVSVAWNEQQRQSLAEKTGENMIAALNSGGNFTKLAKENGLIVSTTKAFSRFESGENFSRELVNEIFKAKTGFSVGSKVTKGYAVARLKKVIAANPTNDSQQFDALKQSLSQALRNDMLRQLADGLGQRFPVSINLDAINANF